jgi:hypothetical protein
VAKTPNKIDGLGRAVPRAVPALSKRAVEAGRFASRAIREAAGTDYITDIDGHTVRWHYERKDRSYSESVGWKAFEIWSMNDRWKERRKLFWVQIEERVRQHFGDRILRQRLDDMEKFETLINVFDGYLQPLKNDDGSIKLNKETGLPVFALEMPPLDKFMTMYLKLHERVMLLRGEATKRTETVEASVVDAHKRGRLAPQISSEDARAMARTLLEKRMLVDRAPPVVVASQEAKDAVHVSSARDDDNDEGDGGAGEGS